MLVTALSPRIGYDNAAKVAHHAFEHDLTLREACMVMGLLDGDEFDRLVDPRTMLTPQLEAH
jgi:fumarate hydratase class II